MGGKGSTSLAKIHVPPSSAPGEKRSILSFISETAAAIFGMSRSSASMCNSPAACAPHESFMQMVTASPPASNSATGSKPVSTIDAPVSTLSSTPPSTSAALASDAMHHQLDLTAYAVKHKHRMVRSRLYFSSESHLHAMLNILRFGAYGEFVAKSHAVRMYVTTVVLRRR